MFKVSEGHIQKFTVATLLIAFLTIAWVSQVNRQYYFAIVYGERPVRGQTATMALVTRASKKPLADEALIKNTKRVNDWGWKVISVEASRAEEFQEAFSGLFRNRPTQSSYLSFSDSERRPLRMLFFDAPDSLLEDFRERIVEEGFKGAKIIESWHKDAKTV